MSVEPAMRAREKFLSCSCREPSKTILDHADELAKRFEQYEPNTDDERGPAVFTELRRSVMARSDAERSIRDAVAEARRHGYSWRTIGPLIGTSGEAARQRYGTGVNA